MESFFILLLFARFVGGSGHRCGSCLPCLPPDTSLRPLFISGIAEIGVRPVPVLTPISACLSDHAFRALLVGPVFRSLSDPPCARDRQLPPGLPRLLTRPQDDASYLADALLSGLALPLRFVLSDSPPSRQTVLASLFRLGGALPSFAALLAGSSRRSLVRSLCLWKGCSFCGSAAAFGCRLVGRSCSAASLLDHVRLSACSVVLPLPPGGAPVRSSRAGLRPSIANRSAACVLASVRTAVGSASAFLRTLCGFLFFPAPFAAQVRHGLRWEKPIFVLLFIEIIRMASSSPGLPCSAAASLPAAPFPPR